MVSAQEWLNNKYPTKEDKAKVKEITVFTNDKEELNLSEYPNLEIVDIYWSYLKTKLTKLELGNKTKLKELDCSHNQLFSLDVSGCNALKEFNCSNNRLASLNVSSCTSIIN